MRAVRRRRIDGRVFGYCRVSSRRQDTEGTSLEGQEQSIARWCRSQGLPAPARIAVEVESGSAEKTEQRVEQTALQREAKAGDTIVVAAVDRWSRDIVHAVSTVRALVARGVRWVALRESLDATTREGEERLGLMAWVADSERKRIKERTLGRKRELQDEGFYTRGRPPVGYVIQQRKLVPGPDADVVREAFRRCIAGDGIDAIAQALPMTAGCGGHRPRKAWDKKGVHGLLRNRHYLGELERSDGTWHPAHEALVDRDTWERAHAAMLARKLRGRPHGEGFSAERLLRGLAVCSVCGRRVSVVLGRERVMGGRTMSYVCAGALAGLCKVRHVHAERLDALAAQATLRRLVELRRELASGQPLTSPPATQDHAAKIAQAKRKRERLISLAVDGTITGEELKARLGKLDAEIGKLEAAAGKARRATAAAERARRPEARAEVLGRVEGLTAAWNNLPAPQRREVLSLLADRIEVVPAPRARTHDVVPPRIRWRTVEALTAEV